MTQARYSRAWPPVIAAGGTRCTVCRVHYRIRYEVAAGSLWDGCYCSHRASPACWSRFLRPGRGGSARIPQRQRLESSAALVRKCWRTIRAVAEKLQLLRVLPVVVLQRALMVAIYGGVCDTLGGPRGSAAVLALALIAGIYSCGKPEDLAGGGAPHF